MVHLSQRRAGDHKSGCLIAPVPGVNGTISGALGTIGILYFVPDQIKHSGYAKCMARLCCRVTLRSVVIHRLEQYIRSLTSFLNFYSFLFYSASANQASFIQSWSVFQRRNRLKKTAWHAAPSHLWHLRSAVFYYLCLGGFLVPHDISNFFSPAGQNFFYWLIFILKCLICHILEGNPEKYFTTAVFFHHPTGTLKCSFVLHAQTSIIIQISLMFMGMFYLETRARLDAIHSRTSLWRWGEFVLLGNILEMSVAATLKRTVQAKKKNLYF